MSTDFSIRPVGTPAPSPVVQLAGWTANNTVATDLPSSQAVNAPDSAAATTNDTQFIKFDISHEAYYDRAAGSMVYQAVNQQTDEVVTQYPDDAALRRRAYFNSLEQSKGDQSHSIPTDRVA